MRIAVISDVHGNYWALTSVLKDIDKRKPDLIVNLGDSLYGPLKSNDTFRLFRSYDIISISGHQDRTIIGNLRDESNNMTLRYV
jgi:predicted phosphodiesterase